MTGIVRLDEEEIEKLIPSVFPNGFMKKDFALSYMAEDGLSAGVLAGTLSRGTVFIRYFYVDPHFRRIGVGRSLLDEVTKRADFYSLKVGISVYEGDLSADLDSLLFLCGFKRQASLPVLTFSLNDIKNFLPGEPKMPKNIITLENARSGLKAYSNFLCSKEGGGYPPIRPDELLGDSVFYQKDDKIEGSLLISKNNEDLEITFIHSKSPRILSDLITGAYLLAARHHPLSTKVYAAFLKNALFESARRITNQEDTRSRTLYFERVPSADLSV